VSKRLADLLTVAGAQPLGESLTQLRTTCAELDEFVHGIIDELAALHNELDLRRQQLNDAWRELDQNKREAGEAAVDPKLKEQLETLEAERGDLRRELEATNTRLAKLAAVAVGVAESKAEAASAKSELASVRAELAETKSVLARQREAAAHGGSDAEHQLLAQLEDQARERSLTETQLESVRERAAELAVQLEEQQRQFAEERQRWQSQLADLTRLVANQNRTTHSNSTSETIVTEAPRCSATALRRSGHRAESDSPQGNPVIDSVMAQFQMVQREAARRRAKAS
jgi:chromosome segregation ATPase